MTATQIIEAKHAAGPDAYLWVQATAGDVILWPDEASSVGDDGARALNRWHVTPEVEDELIASGEADVN